jgi:hypothetical protein
MAEAVPVRYHLRFLEQPKVTKAGAPLCSGPFYCAKHVRARRALCRLIRAAMWQSLPIHLRMSFGTEGLWRGRTSTLRSIRLPLCDGGKHAPTIPRGLHPAALIRALWSSCPSRPTTSPRARGSSQLVGFPETMICGILPESRHQCTRPTCEKRHPDPISVRISASTSGGLKAQHSQPKLAHPQHAGELLVSYSCVSARFGIRQNARRRRTVRCVWLG